MNGKSLVPLADNLDHNLSLIRRLFLGRKHMFDQLDMERSFIVMTLRGDVARGYLCTRGLQAAALC